MNDLMTGAKNALDAVKLQRVFHETHWQLLGSIYGSTTVIRKNSSHKLTVGLSNIWTHVQLVRNFL